MNWSKSCLSPDAAFVASGSSQGSLHVWDTVTGGCILRFHKQHQGAICGTVWHPFVPDMIWTASDKDRSIVQWGSS